MTIKEVLINSSVGEFPKVTLNIDLKKDKVKAGTVGQIVVVKYNTTHSGYRGIAVQFPGLSFDVWFHEQPSEDKRSAYMKDLTFVSNE